MLADQRTIAITTKGFSSVIKYSIVRGKRIKTSEIIVDRHSVIVRAPTNKPVQEIEEIVKRKAGWILKKQRECQIQIPSIIKPLYLSGSTLPYLGDNCLLTILASDERESRVRLVGGEFLVTMRPNVAEASRVKRKAKALYAKWLGRQAEQIMIERINFYSKKLGVIPKQIIIKDLRGRWGSASKDGIISLNVNLLKAPRNVIDYVVLHELCHLKITNHSHHYWDLLHKFMPSYNDYVDWLKINGDILLERNVSTASSSGTVQ